MHSPVSKLPAKPPVRLRARRGKSSEAAARRPVTHIALPGHEIARAQPRSRETVTAFLRRTGWATRDLKYGWGFRNGLPTILQVNGEPVLRQFWRTTRIAANDNVQFISRPLGGQRGGSGKQVLGLVALVAITAFAFWAGPVLFGSGTFLAYGATAAISIGGSLLINALTAPKAGATNDPAATQDQIYTATAQGNTAKLGQPLPIGYGREKVFPDFAAAPWSEFVGNDQYQNILLSIGMGRYDYEQLFIDDTPFWDPINGVAPAFASAQVEFYDPGEQILIFPTSVSSSTEVAGQQLPGGTDGQPGAWIGGYVANPAGTNAYQIAIDFVFPAGCFVTDQEGRTAPLAIGLSAERRVVNDAGVPISNWAVLFDETRSYANRAPIRDSMVISVPDGRYEVRFRRNSAPPADNQGAGEVVWAGLRAFLRGNNSFADVSTIAIRIKGTQSTQGSFKFGAIRTRILPVWNGSTFVEQPTRNPAWAFIDAVVNEQYGSGHSISKVDFNAVVNHAAGCDARGDSFDYTFAAAVVVPEALDKILTPSRAKHFWLGDTISIVRDEWRDVPSMLLTDREIVRDSTQISWTMLGDQDPDAVIVEYIDQQTWRPAQVQYPPEIPGAYHATNPESKRIDGVVNRDHAFREAAFYYLQSIYRRESVQIATEYEGRAITFGSVLRVQSELPMAFGYGGAVLNQSGNHLTLSPPPSWADAGQHFIRLRRPNGKWFGPVLVSRGASDAIAILDVPDLASVVAVQGMSLDGVLAREAGGENPSFEFGTAENQSRLCVVLSGQPNGNQCTLNLVVDDQRVHVTDIGNPPILPTAQFPADLSAPLIVGLNANFGQGIAEPKLSASWFPAAGAFYYVAEVSYDSGQTWMQIYEGRDSQFSVVVTLAALTLRVQGVGKLHGPYSQVMLGAPTIEIASNTVALQSLNDGIAYQVSEGFRRLSERFSDFDGIADLVADEIARNRIDKTGLRGQVWGIRSFLRDETFELHNQVTTTIALNKDSADAAISQVSDLAVGTAASFASDQTTVSAKLGAIQSEVTTTSSALSTLMGSFASYQTYVTSLFGSTNASVTSEAFTRATADTALSALITSLTNTVGSNTAAITNESITRSNADGSLATQINTVTSTVGAHTSSLSVIQSSINGISLQYGLVGTIDGVTGGFILQGARRNDGAIAFGVLINADEVVINGSVKTKHIAAGNVTAILMAANSITAGNAAISALAVQTLNIAGNAVTVITVASDAGPRIDGDRCILTMPIDTTGLAGAVIPVILVGSYDNSIGAVGGTSVTLFAIANGVRQNVRAKGVNQSGFSTTPMVAMFEFVATGSLQYLQFGYNIGADNGNVYGMILTAVAAKR